MNEEMEGYCISYRGSVLVPNGVRQEQEVRFMAALKTSAHAIPPRSEEFEHDDDLFEPIPLALVERLSAEESLFGKESFYQSDAEMLFKQIVEEIDDGDESVKKALLNRYQVSSYVAAAEQLADELRLQDGALAKALLVPIRAREEAEEMRQTGRALQIFDFANLSSEEDSARAKSAARDVRDQVLNGRKNAMRFEGLRLLPCFADAMKKLRSAVDQFANFETVIKSLDDELTLAEYMPPSQFAVRPILMDGAPGIGKTAFALHVANILGVPFEKVSAAGLQNGFVLCGSSKQWGNSAPGVIFNLLSETKYATGVLLIDEVDKLSTDDRYTTVPALLDLLERESARFYKDESVDVKFDASRLIVLMTSNSLENVNPALQSRCEVFEIQEPSDIQRLNIMEKLIGQMNDGIEPEKQIELDEEAALELASKKIDLRELIAATRTAYVSAIRDGSRLAKPFIKKGREKIALGFIPRN